MTEIAEPNEHFPTGWNRSLLMPLPKIQELLSRNELYGTWRYFEERYQLINSINFLSISGYFGHQEVHRTCRFVLLATKLHKSDYHHMRVEYAKKILNCLYSNDYIAVELRTTGKYGCVTC